VGEDAAQTRSQILLVDDEMAVLDVTRLILEHFGFAVLTAQSGTDALTMFNRHADHVQAVILDLTMPDMGGGEVYKLIRARNPQVPILLSSGYMARSLPPELTDQPYTAFLQKPYQAAALIDKVKSLIGASG
jgi:CheY-like chemotaxis protein